jgi:hypothetical protein
MSSARTLNDLLTGVRQCGIDPYMRLVEWIVSWTWATIVAIVFLMSPGIVIVLLAQAAR